jgi:surface antigen
MALGGCGPDGPTKSDTGLAIGAITGGLIGNSVGNGGGRAAATIVGAVVGGVVGSEIGRSMDEQDRRLAAQAEFDAFESGYDGRPVRWKNEANGRYGDVVPMERHRRGDQDCRDYTHTVYMNGRPETMRGTACRDADGRWRNVG